MFKSLFGDIEHYWSKTLAHGLLNPTYFQQYHKLRYFIRNVADQVNAYR